MDTQIAAQPTRQALAVVDRSLPGKVTGRLRKAIDFMVWQGASRAEAAVAAGLKDHSLRQALKRPHVLSAYLQECEVLRLSGRAKRIHHLNELAAQRTNMNAAVAAIKAAEHIGDDNQAPGRALVPQMPGITVVINQPSPRLDTRGPLIDITSSEVIDADRE